MKLIERILDESNIRLAQEQVIGNKGAGGVDGMSVNQLATYMTEHYADIKRSILAREYRPRPVRRVEIPKPTGGVRKLGLKVNATKTRICRPRELKYLGFGFWKSPKDKQWKARPHEDSVAKCTRKLKRLCKRSWSISKDAD